MPARQTTTKKVIVTRVRTPKKTSSSNKNYKQRRCSKCGRFM